MPGGQGVDLGAAHELHREYARRAELGIDLGEADVGVRGEVRAEPGVVRGLDPEVGLVVDRVDEVPGVADRIVAPPQRAQCEDPREPDQDDRVALDLAAHAGAQDLDRDLAAILEARAVDLCDRGRRDRGLVELGEQLADRLAEVGLEDRADLAKRERR